MPPHDDATLRRIDELAKKFKKLEPRVTVSLMPITSGFDGAYAAFIGNKEPRMGYILQNLSPGPRDKLSAALTSNGIEHIVGQRNIAIIQKSFDEGGKEEALFAALDQTVSTQGDTPKPKSRRVR
jgi:hypothetical protein